MWIASDCVTSSKRENLIAELKKKIRVDGFGKCGAKKCNEEKCLQYINRDYYFFLAFENSVCNGYVSEKFWEKGLQQLTIPIVLSRNLIENFAPPNSFVAVDDFLNVTELANYLNYLILNRTAYLEYFEWRNEFDIFAQESPDFGYCRLCRKLHEPISEMKFYQNMEDWWLKQANCQEDFAVRYAVG